MRLPLAIGSIIFCLSGQIFAAESGLDAPAVLDRPTVRTELWRARVASSSCLLPTTEHHLPWTMEGHRDLWEYYRCMQKIRWDAALYRTYSDSFAIGIYFAGAMESAILLEVVETDPIGRKSETSKTLRKHGKEDLDSSIDIAKKTVHITLGEICEVVNPVDCPFTLAQFAKWGWVSAPPR